MRRLACKRVTALARGACPSAPERDRCLPNPIPKPPATALKADPAEFGDWPSTSSNAPLTLPIFPAVTPMRHRTNPRLAQLKTAAWQSISGDSIASAKAWVHIASVQLLIRRLACS
jgi:hypothetical protein